LLPSCRDRRERASAGQTFRKQAGLVGGAPLPTPVDGSLREPTNIMRPLETAFPPADEPCLLPELPVYLGYTRTLSH